MTKDIQVGKNGFPPQHQNVQPGQEDKMTPTPEQLDNKYKGSGKLDGKVAIITGGDSGIGKSIAFTMPKKGLTLSLFI